MQEEVEWSVRWAVVRAEAGRLRRAGAGVSSPISRDPALS